MSTHITPDTIAYLAGEGTPDQQQAFQAGADLIDEVYAYYATKEEAEADVAERFCSIYKVVHLDDAACQEEAKRELGLLTWGPVWEIDGAEVAADLVRDHRRHLITWAQVKNQHRARTNSN